MPTINLTPPTWVSGELLSAGKLNQLGEGVNAIKGASVAPTATFARTGNDAVWWFRRRRWRYLHVSFTTAATGGGGSCTTRIEINGVTVYNDGTFYSSGTTQTFDLDATDVAEGDTYSVAVSYDADDASHETTGIVESSSATKAGIGSYSTPADFGGSETAAQFLTDLQSQSTAVASLGEVVVTPSATWLRVREPWTFEMRRKFRYLIVAIEITGGESPDVDVFVNGTKVVDSADETAVHTIDLSGVSGGPSVRDFYSLEVRRNAGVAIVNYIYETETPDSTVAPAWSHGDEVNGTAADFQDYADVLNAAHAILGAAGWQMPCIERPYEDPRWGLRKTKRYLHYQRDGSTAATLEDPANVQPDISLSRTTGDEWAVYDLDTIDWLSPGGLLYAYECDVIWLDDEP